MSSLGCFDVKSNSLKFSFCRHTGLLIASEAQSGRLLFKTNEPLYFQPTIDGRPAKIDFQRVHESDGKVTLVYIGEFFKEIFVEFSVSEEDDAIDASCRYILKAGTQLNRVEILPTDTSLNLVDVFNFRNRHHTPAVSPELPIGGNGCQTDTYSGDWQFAPHPTALAFRTSEGVLFCGLLDMASSFGIRFSAKNYSLQYWFLDYGEFPHGNPIASGAAFDLPRFRFFFRGGEKVHDTYSEFGTMLVNQKAIPEKSEISHQPWHRTPIYCTWIDQVFESDAELHSELALQAEGVRGAVDILDEKMVLRAADCIRREELPFGIFIIDDGWQVARGQWEPNQKKFSNFRGIVDRLHAQGLKVVVWWNWAEISPDAEVDPSHLAGENWLNRHGYRMRDYSNPRTQSEYLKPLFRKLFSSDPDCLDLDGVKTDFLADKIHPETPLHDPLWRGEENYFRRVTNLFYEEMKSHKPEAIHIGCSGNYWLSEFIDINRTYDVTSSNWKEHEERGKMLAATTHHTPVSYDFHMFEEFQEKWFHSARRSRASVQIGNVLWVKRDRFALVEPAGSDYWDKLRTELASLQG